MLHLKPEALALLPHLQHTNYGTDTTVFTDYIDVCGYLFFNDTTTTEKAEKRERV